GCRQPDLEPAAAALAAKSVDVAKAIGSVYGAEAEQAFLPLWRKHIGMVVDYTVGAATRDRAMQDKAGAGPVGYSAGHRRPGDAAQGGGRPRLRHADIRRVPQIRDPDPAEAGGGRPREAPRPD